MSATDPQLNQYPQSDMQMEDVISRFVSTMIVTNEWRFFTQDGPLTAMDVASNNLMLPAILWQAEKTLKLVTGSSLGVQFRSDDKTGIGARAVLTFEPGTSKASYPLCALEVLCSALENYTYEGPDTDVSAPEIRENILMGRKIPPKGSAATLDHLINGFFQDQALGLIPWTPDSQPKQPNLPTPA